MIVFKKYLMLILFQIWYENTGHTVTFGFGHLQFQYENRLWPSIAKFGMLQEIYIQETPHCSKVTPSDVDISLPQFLKPITSFFAPVKWLTSKWILLGNYNLDFLNRTNDAVNIIWLIYSFSKIVHISMSCIFKVSTSSLFWNTSYHWNIYVC